MESILLFVLIFLVDILAVYDLTRLNINVFTKVIITVLIFLFPLVGVSLYYFLRPNFRRVR